ncbi:MAG: MFS transporter [Chloroflexi bacterium]|nr:MFS transporter [Chloroflexota bacterium]
MIPDYIKKRPGFAAFGYREYRLFWAAAAFSNVGMWTLTAGRLWLMHELTDSPVALGLVTLSSLGPILIFSVWGGVVADRVNRLRLVMFTRGMFAVTALLTGVLVATDLITPWQLIAISLVNGFLLSFDIPSRQAMMPSLVGREHLPGAIAMYSFVTTGSAIMGPIFFAPLVKAAGIEGLFYIIGISYIATVGMMAMMRTTPNASTGESRPIFQDLKDGFAYVKRSKVVFGLLIMGIFVGVFGAPYQTLLPVLVEDVIAGDIEDFGGLLLGSGVGASIGAFAMAWWGKPERMGQILLFMGVGFGAALMTLAWSNSLPIAIIAMTAIGITGTLHQTARGTIVQLATEDRYLGRVMSIHQLIWGSSAIGGLILGALASAVDVQFALGLGGAICAGAIAIGSIVILGRGVLAGSEAGVPNPAD